MNEDTKNRKARHLLEIAVCDCGATMDEGDTLVSCIMKTIYRVPSKKYALQWSGFYEAGAVYQRLNTLLRPAAEIFGKKSWRDIDTTYHSDHAPAQHSKRREVLEDLLSIARGGEPFYFEPVAQPSLF